MGPLGLHRVRAYALSSPLCAPKARGTNLQRCQAVSRSEDTGRRMHFDRLLGWRRVPAIAQIRRTSQPPRGALRRHEKTLPGSLEAGPALRRCVLEHGPEKGVPVFPCGKRGMHLHGDHAQTINLAEAREGWWAVRGSNSRHPVCKTHSACEHVTTSGDMTT